MKKKTERDIINAVANISDESWDESLKDSLEPYYGNRKDCGEVGRTLVG